jgi:predicted ATPase
MASRPHNRNRLERGLALRTALGPALMSTKGLGSPEVGANYTQALELCRQLGERPLAQARETSALFNEAELHRLRGELLLLGTSPKPDDAERCFREALEIARRQNAKSLELRTAMSLGRLLERQGNREEARRLVSESYSWFTEGFDTADLKDARTLLDSWAMGEPGRAPTTSP